MKQDASIQQALAGSSQKYIWASENSLLANFLEVVVNKLQEWHLQYIKEFQAKNIWHEKNRLDKIEKSLLAIY